MNAIQARGAKLDEREAALTAREGKLSKEIEATNRVEPPSPSVGGGGAPS